MSPEEKPLRAQQILSAVWRCTLNRAGHAVPTPMDQQRGPTGRLEGSAELAFTRAAEKGADSQPCLSSAWTSRSQRWAAWPLEGGTVSSPWGGCSWADISSVERGLSFLIVTPGLGLFPSTPSPPVPAALPEKISVSSPSQVGPRASEVRKGAGGPVGG